MALTVNDFRTSIAELGKGAIQADQDQAGLVRGERWIWTRTLLNIGGTRETNARTLNALRQAVENDPAYASVARQAEYLLGRMGSTSPLTGKKISQFLSKLDLAAALKGDIPVAGSKDYAATQWAAGRKFMTETSSAIQRAMMIHMSGGKTSFVKDIARGLEIAIAGTTLQPYNEIPEESLLKPGETRLDEDTLVQRRRGAAVENGHNAIARFVTGNAEAAFNALDSKDKVKTLILSGMLSQEMIKPALNLSMKSITPQFEGKRPDGFMLSLPPQGTHAALELDKKANGDFVIRFTMEASGNMMMRNAGEGFPLDEDRSGVSVASSLTISGAEMDRLSELDWSPREGRLPRNYQTNFSEHSLSGELRLFRAE
jgi:hypothetical protein